METATAAAVGACLCGFRPLCGVELAELAGFLARGVALAVEAARAVLVAGVTTAAGSPGSGSCRLAVLAAAVPSAASFEIPSSGGESATSFEIPSSGGESAATAVIGDVPADVPTVVVDDDAEDERRPWAAVSGLSSSLLRDDRGDDGDGVPNTASAGGGASGDAGGDGGDAFDADGRPDDEVTANSTAESLSLEALRFSAINRRRVPPPRVGDLRDRRSPNVCGRRCVRLESQARTRLAPPARTYLLDAASSPRTCRGDDDAPPCPTKIMASSKGTPSLY